MTILIFLLRQFYPGCEVLEEGNTVDFLNANTAQISPLGRQLFRIGWSRLWDDT